MEDNTHKCSADEHSTIDAVKFCQTCNLFLCNKCDQSFHSKLFSSHKVKNLNKEKKGEFINICKESNHSTKYEYFCQTHNKLCCVKCIAKIKDENNGQHKDCTILSLKEAKKEKEKKFNKDYSKLKETSKSLDKTIDQFKSMIQELTKKKEELILEIQKVFTKIRTIINEREDKLLAEVEEIYKNKFYDEKIVKESEKLPLKVKNCLDSIEVLNEIKNKEDELCSEINYYIEFEDNLNRIKYIKGAINNCNSNSGKKISFKYNTKELENIIKQFGIVIINEDENLRDPVNFEKKVNELLQELEDTYGILGFMDEEDAKNKIRAYGCHKDALICWMENSLINGE